MNEAKNKPVRVLHIVGAMYPGGMENFILNLYKNVDRNELQFDIAVHSRKENDYSELIESMGGRIYDLPRMSRHPFQNYAAIKKLVRENGYPVVIRHTANAMIAPQLFAAKRGGALTICHSHNETDPMLAAHKLGRLFMKKAADVKMACSEKAGYWMFGKNAEFAVIHNAIDMQSFFFGTEKREEIRAEFGIKETQHVYGNISNFIASKNHGFQMEVFAEILKKDPEAVFFCIGEGDLRPEIEAKRDALGLKDKVILTGIRKDVESLMSALDVLVFPSFFEGLPLTLIEAQAAGLPILMSDTITESVIVTEGVVTPFSLEKSAEEWAVKAIEMAEKAHNSGSLEDYRKPQGDSIAAHGYDIKALAKGYQEKLLELSK